MARKNPETVVVSGLSEPISFSVRIVGCGGRTDKPTHYRTIHRIVLPISFALRACFLETRSQVRVFSIIIIKNRHRNGVCLFMVAGAGPTNPLIIEQSTGLFSQSASPCGLASWKLVRRFESFLS